MADNGTTAIIVALISITGTLIIGGWQILAQRNMNKSEAKESDASAVEHIATASQTIVSLQEDTISRLSKEVDGLKGRIDILRKDVEYNKEQSEQLSARVEQSDSENSMLRKLVEELRSSNVLLSKENASLRLKLATINVDIAKAQADATEAKVALLEMEKRNKQLEDEVATLRFQVTGKFDRNQSEGISSD